MVLDIIEPTTGYFYKSPLDNQDYFFVEVIIEKCGSNVIANIYELEDHNIRGGIGDSITVSGFDIELVVSIDIWNKYYFPTWNNENNQYYHNDTDGKSDTIGSRAWIMKIALKLGLEIGEIETY